MKGGVCFDYKTKYTKNRNGIDMSYHGNWYFKRMQWKQPSGMFRPKKTRMNLQQNPKRKKLRKIKRCICRIPRL